MAEAASKNAGGSDQNDGQLELVTGRQTAAILMLLFDDNEAAKILERLEPQEVEMLGEAMISVADVDAIQIDGSLERFLQLTKNQTMLAYKSDEKVGRVFRQALGTSRAETMMNRFAPKRPSNIAEILKWIPVKDLAELVSNEPPQISAVLISFMTPEVAAEMLQLLPQGLQEELVYRVATLGPVSAHALAQIHALLEDNGPSAEEIAPPMEIGGVMDTASIINSLPKQLSQAVLKGVTKRDRKIGKQIEDEMFVFADLMNLSSKDIGTVVRKVDTAILVPALRGASAELKEKMFAAMSQRAAETIQDEIDEAPPQPMEAVINAQKGVIAIAKVMLDNGEISMSGGGADYV
ncbi:flagellar motor switch protein FliG [Parasphingorhabdus litoris]|uniref:Flagellar motor switch protein FliG n=1 Tax=Parasphingorhabdus litoris TaxID=394733 RepID=A0ABN1A3Y8_9SPHN|nr:FliG C-terminal domain-containing protein [Parasphingorhabdus litoris]